jgi:Recombinase
MLPETTARAELMRPIIDGLQALSANQAAAVLNKRNVPSPRGGQWSVTQVISIRKRLAAIRRTKT